MISSKAKQNKNPTKIRSYKQSYENKNNRQSPPFVFATECNLIFKHLSKCIGQKYMKITQTLTGYILNHLLLHIENMKILRNFTTAKI